MNKILVIDDEAMLRETVRLLLEREGYEVAEAPDGETGAGRARAHLPDLILCDVNMNGRPDAGYATLARLREDPATASIPFILMTGFADDAGMRRGMELGADDYLKKPFQAEELYAAVQARLRKIQTVRDEAEKKLSQLRSHISLLMPHELRTPLNGIIANAELLADPAAPPAPAAVAELSQEIRQSAVRLERLIENFLIFAQLEIAAGDPQSVSALRAGRGSHAAEIARDEAIAQADHAGRSQNLVLHLDPQAVPAMADDYFRKIVAELLQNALRFSEPGSRVNATLAAHADSFEFSVADGGRGFSPEQIRRIGAYVQFDREMADEQGIGLGLAIVKKLAELHGGTLAIASQPGEGAAVTVKLPRAR